MLTFVGLGLYDEDSTTVRGRRAIENADRVFAEFYTSRLVGATVDDLEAAFDTRIEVRDREGVEQDPSAILDAAESGDVVFVTAGDTMISTTHTDLRLRAADRGIETRVIHAPTAESAASSLTGLQNYRFGKATTLPFEWAHGADGVPQSVIDTIEDNQERGLHTLVYLDIKVGVTPPSDRNAARYGNKVGRGPHGEDPLHEEYMSASHAASLLAEHWDADVLGVVVARAGSPDALVRADTLARLATEDFGTPLHLLVIPGTLHHIEADALQGLAGAPPTLAEPE